MEELFKSLTSSVSSAGSRTADAGEGKDAQDPPLVVRSHGGGDGAEGAEEEEGEERRGGLILTDWRVNRETHQLEG